MGNQQEQKPRRGAGFWAAAFVAVFFFLSTMFLAAMLIGSFTAWHSLLTTEETRQDTFKEVIVEGSGDKKIVLVPVEGIIRTSSSGFFPDDTGVVENFKKQLEHIKKDEQVEAILLQIESPGGGITASDIIYEEILRYKEEKGKKVVVLMGNIAASGAYYISMAADTIVAHPTTITGSIGVIFPLINISELIHRYGIEDTSITSGKMKDLGSPTRPMRPEEKAVLEDIIRQMYERFVSVVASGRNMTVEEVEKIADGRIYTAQQALDNGLVDRLGYLPDAIKLAKELAGLDEALVIKYKRRWRLGDLLKMAEGLRSPGTYSLTVWPKMKFPGLMYLWLPGFSHGIMGR